MVNLLRAEWQKVVGNRWVTFFLIWIFPAGAAVFIAGSLFFALVSDSVRQSVGHNFFGDPYQWPAVFINVWDFPKDLAGRIFLLGLTAVTFAGEYQWGTWKNIIPRRQRTPLLVAKFIVLGGMVILSFCAMSLIMGLGRGLLAAMASESYGPPLTWAVLTEFLGDYSFRVALTLVSTLIAAIFVILPALYTHSIFGGIMVGMGIAIIEPLSALLLFALGGLFDNFRILYLFRFSPLYNLSNLDSWITQNQPSASFATEFFKMADLAVPADSMGFSIAALALWVGLGIGLILWIFHRQDITG